jgi:hypothetical protein
MSQQNLEQIKKSPPSLISDASRTFMKVVQPPTNRKNGAQIAHDVKKLLKEHCH